MTNCWRRRRVWSGSTRMTFQMSCLTNCSCWKWLSLSALKSIKDFAELILITHSESYSSFPHIITACLLCLTFPVADASAERSFSKMKLIKTFLCSTMSQVRVNSLAILSNWEPTPGRRRHWQHHRYSFADNKARKKVILELNNEGREVEFTFWYLYFLLLAEMPGLQISVFYATVVGQASVTMWFFWLRSSRWLGFRGRGRHFDIPCGLQGMLGRLGKFASGRFWRSYATEPYSSQLTDSVFCDNATMHSIMHTSSRPRFNIKTGFIWIEITHKNI